MKNILTISILALVILFSGCRKDDDDKDNNVGPHYFSYDGKKYALDQGLVINFGEMAPSLYNFDILLFSDDFDFGTPENDFEDVSGVGNMLYFELLTDQQHGLGNADYLYDESNVYKKNTFISSWLMVAFNIATEQAQIEQEINAGKIKIARTGNNFELTIDSKAANGKVVKGYYNGILGYVDYSEFDEKKIKQLKSKALR
jgi:protein involved in sex pheromone biosynthesis